MTGEEQLQAVRLQIEAAERGELHELACPYCGVINQQGKPLCCTLFAQAAVAVMHAQDVEAQLKLAQLIHSRVN